MLRLVGLCRRTETRNPILKSPVIEADIVFVRFKQFIVDTALARNASQTNQSAIVSGLRLPHVLFVLFMSFSLFAFTFSAHKSCDFPIFLLRNFQIYHSRSLLLHGTRLGHTKEKDCCVAHKHLLSLYTDYSRHAIIMYWW